jgi:hypothetical protein
MGWVLWVCFAAAELRKYLSTRSKRSLPDYRLSIQLHGGDRSHLLAADIRICPVRVLLSLRRFYSAGLLSCCTVCSHHTNTRALLQS